MVQWFWFMCVLFHLSHLSALYRSILLRLYVLTFQSRKPIQGIPEFVGLLVFNITEIFSPSFHKKLKGWQVWAFASIIKPCAPFIKSAGLHDGSVLRRNGRSWSKWTEELSCLLNTALLSLQRYGSLTSNSLIIFNKAGGTCVWRARAEKWRPSSNGICTLWLCYASEMQGRVSRCRQTAKIVCRDESLPPDVSHYRVYLHRICWEWGGLNMALALIWRKTTDFYACWAIVWNWIMNITWIQLIPVTTAPNDTPHDRCFMKHQKNCLDITKHHISFQLKYAYL